MSKAYNGSDTVCKLTQEYVQDDDTVVYIKLFVLLYADDTIIMAESRSELQAALNGMSHYCKMWKMEVNTLKTKVVVFGRRKGNHEADFIFGNTKVSVVSEYTYLGILMSCNGNMSKNIARLKNGK